MSSPSGVLYAGGRFTQAGGVLANNVAKWDGVAWTALDSGVEDGGLHVRTFAEYGLSGDDQVYAVGAFTLAGGAPANYAARWDGFDWNDLGEGLNQEGHSALVTDVFGPKSLVVTGRFSSAGGLPVACSARWTCKRVADANGDGSINIADFVAVLLAWGPCPTPPIACEADVAPIGGDGEVNVDDLIAILLEWE
jgi:hypothetical protein